jgi:hypothetical protein
LPACAGCEDRCEASPFHGGRPPEFESFQIFQFS